MKIMHILWGLKYGGAETMLVDIVNQQCFEHEVELIIGNRDIDADLLSQINPQVKIIQINRPPKSKNPFYILKLDCILLFSKADIIHCQMDNIIKYFPLYFLKRNICLTVHCVRLGYKDIRKYNRVFAISEEVRESVKKQTGVEAQVVYNGIEIQKFNREKRNRSDGKFHLVQIGRLDHLHKGQHLTLKAIHSLVTQYNYTDIHLDVIGEGDSEQYLKDIADSLNINAYVTFLGTRTKDYIRKNLTYYDLLVQPSLWEGFGLTIIEAMGAMVPTLISNVDGMKTTSLNGTFSYTFQSGNVEDYAEKLYRIIQLPVVERKIFAEKAYQYAYDHFDISTTVKNYGKQYQHIISKK
ncbi:MAG: glycosyltransferase [Candidatus Azobacteroides sp.]|nr:glycosyltransferase [Candidatus Azobacteroides sp.]